MAARRSYTVAAPAGSLNLREKPSLAANVISQIPTGSKVKIDPKADTPDGWKAVDGGGYVMSEYLK